MTVEERQEITDPKLLTKVRTMIRQEHAGFISEGSRCVEPGCSCWERAPEDRDPVSGPFRTPAVRCSSFEELVLPLDPGLEEAYWQHIEEGQTLILPRCAWIRSDGSRCRKEATAPNARYCEGHALLSKRRSNRESTRKRRQGKTGTV